MHYLKSYTHVIRIKCLNFVTKRNVMCIAKEEEMTMEKKQARWIYKTMNEIRYFEEKVHKILVMVKFLIRSLVCG